jgi:hypothetical protein
MTRSVATAGVGLAQSRTPGAETGLRAYRAAASVLDHPAVAFGVAACTGVTRTILCETDKYL